MSANPPTNEIGNLTGEPSATGWRWFVPGDDLEKVPELQWPTNVAVYAGMMNDAQLYSLYQGFMWPIRAYDWYIDPNGAKPEIVDRIATDYNLPVGPRRDGREWNRRRGARRFSFDKHIEDALRGPQYGHYPFEQVGEVLDTDQKWHLRKLAARPPRTLNEINVSNDGSLESFRQIGMDLHKPPISINRSVWYVWDREGANWTGRSMLRSVYRNYLTKDRVLRVGAINIERAGGIPYVNAPEGASGDQIRSLDDLARRFRVGEAAGAALPHGAQLKFAAAAGGDGAVAYIKQQNEEMARAFLQMVNMLGQTNSGSRALGGTFLDIAQVAQWTIGKWFCDIFNEHVIEDDVEWNEGPTEEYAPLLAFDAGGSHPLEAFQEADGEDTGLQVNDPETRAMLELDPDPRRSRRRTAARRSSGGHEVGAAAVQESAASPLLLPSRPLRRQPYDHEVQAAVNFAAIDSTFDSALDLLMLEVRLEESFQIDALRDAVVSANGDMAVLASLVVEPSGVSNILSRLLGVASLGADQAVQEARAQGIEVPRQDVSDAESALRARADAVARVISSALSQSASREAIRLTGGALQPAEVAESVAQHLRELTGTYERDVLGGAVSSAINAGRRLVFLRDSEPGEIRASELLDSNTCSSCVANDGRQYASVEDADRDYPTGHFKDCDGRERCRGMIIKVYSNVRDPA